MADKKTDTDALLSELRQQNLKWETARPGSREENEAAEAATRAMSELDTALCDGAPLPVPWQRAQYPRDELPRTGRGSLRGQIMTHCPACGMVLADPQHTLTDPRCQSAVTEFLESREPE